MRKLVAFLLLPAFLHVYCEVEQRINTCSAGESCIPHYECEAVTTLTSKGRLTTEERTYLRTKLCNSIDRLNYFCCAIPKKMPTTIEPPQKPNLPEPPVCGIYFSDNIYNGQKTYIDEYPWFALIEYSNGDRRAGHFCGGSIINNRYILTAAHCNQNLPKNWRISHVRLGEWDTTTNPDCQIFENGEELCNEAYVEVPVVEIIIHPDFRAAGAAQYNDLALLKLEREIEFNSWIKPICLPLDPRIRGLNFTSQALEVTGFGATESDFKSPIKMRVELQGVAQESCKEFYNSKGVKIEDNQICVGDKGGKDSCNGDSGGPLMQYKKYPHSNFAYYMLIGIVSFGPRECGTEAPGVYGRVADYMDWIIEKTL